MGKIFFPSPYKNVFENVFNNLGRGGRFAGYFDELVLDPLADWTAAALHGPPEPADVEFTPVSLNLIQETKYSTLLDRPDIKLFSRKGSRVGSY